MNDSRQKSRKWYRLLIVLAGSFLLYQMVYFVDAKTVEKEKTKPEQLVESLGAGYNLGNIFDTVGEQGFENPEEIVTLIQDIKNQGFKSIRIPITWTGHIDETLGTYDLDTTYLQRLDQVIGYALNENLFVVINLQNDSWKWINKMGTDDTVFTRYNAIWQQLAQHYKEYPKSLIFEALNQPQFEADTEKDQYKLLNKLLKSFQHIIRSSGAQNKTRLLLFPTLEGRITVDSCKTLYTTIAKLKDDNIAASIAYYGLWDFSVNAAGKTRFDKTVKNDIKEKFTVLSDQLINKNIPVICTEYSLLALENLPRTLDRGEVLKYFEYINYLAGKKAIILFLWDVGNLYNRETDSWMDQELYQMMKASWEGRSAYAQTDQIYIKDISNVKDVTLAVTLNTRQLIDLYMGSNRLIKDQDYTYQGKQLTIKAELLQKYVTNKLGEKAVLSLCFSGGRDWQIQIIQYQDAILTPAQGTTKKLEIPVEYNGDQLATMKAIYTKDKKTTGPLTYSPYQESGYSFYSDYQNNKIILTENFLNTLKNEEIRLTFLFQSGHKIDYLIIKKDEGVESKDYKDYANRLAQEREEELRNSLHNKFELEEKKRFSLETIYSKIPLVVSVEKEEISDQEVYLIMGANLFVGFGGSFYLLKQKNKFAFHAFFSVDKYSDYE